MRIACLLLAGALAAAERSPERERLLGHLVSVLGAERTVSMQVLDGTPVLWTDARLGRVSYPTAKTKDAPLRHETEPVPNAGGVVIKVYGPFALDAVARMWSDRDDEKTRARERVYVISAPGAQPREALALIMTYGEHAPRELLDRLAAFVPRAP